MTAADVITPVRIILKDKAEGGDRWSDDDLLRYLSDAQRNLYHQNPAQFLASGDSIDTPVELTDLTDTMKVDENLRPMLVHLVVASALMEDSDDARNAERASEFEKRALGATGVRRGS